MSEITVYTFEGEDDEPVTMWSTQDSTEAREYARTNGCSLIANTYVWDDSELVEDYRPGHALDGTPICWLDLNGWGEAEYMDGGPEQAAECQKLRGDDTCTVHPQSRFTPGFHAV